MDENEKNRLEKLEKQKRKQLDRQNKYINANYDRIGIVVPKGQKAIIENRSKEKGFKTITEYLKALIDQDASTAATLPGAEEPEQIKPEPIKDPYDGIGWEGESLPFG